MCCVNITHAQRRQLFALDLKDRCKKIPFYGGYVGARVRGWALRNAYIAHARRLEDSAHRFDADYLADRVGYYNRIAHEFTVNNPHALGEYHYQCASAYVVDMCNATRGFSPQLKVDGIFGDKSIVPPHPSVIKCRPLVERNANAILLKLDSGRHFNFVRDPLPFTAKKNIAVWRGNSRTNETRRRLLQDWQSHPLCDIRAIARKNAAAKLNNAYMSLSAQLMHKFIISIEGRDVATNTKWIMSSNSLCFMPTPTCETWFMEGRLQPGVHYVPLAADCADLEEKIRHYTTHTDEALAIIANAQQHVAQFQHPDREALIIHRVLQKYFQDSGQLPR